MPRKTLARFQVSLVLCAAFAVAMCINGPAEAAHEDGKVLILAQPFARADAIWMALAQRFFKDEQLAVSVKWVPSGTEALRTLPQGQDGEKRGPLGFVVASEVLALDAWQKSGGEFTAIAPLARDADGYVAVAKAGTASAHALKTKTIGVQLGSASAWFLSEYLRAHGLGQRDVALRNQPPAAILGWDPEPSDVAAFFVREPHATQALQKLGDKVRRLTTAKGYAQGYLLLATWKPYLREHPGVAERILRALDRGRRHAADHPDQVIHFAREMFTRETAAVEADYASMERLLGIDRATVEDFRKLGRWMKDAGLLAATADPTAVFDPEPLRAVFPERVAPALRR